MKYAISISLLFISFSISSQLFMDTPDNNLKSQYGTESTRLFLKFILNLNDNDICTKYSKVVLLKDDQLIDTLDLKARYYSNQGFRTAIHRINSIDKIRLDSVLSTGAKRYEHFNEHLYKLEYNFSYLEHSSIQFNDDTLLLQTRFNVETWITKVLFDKKDYPKMEEKRVIKPNGHTYLRSRTLYTKLPKKQLLKETELLNPKRMEKKISTWYDQEGKISMRKTKQPNGARTINITEEYIYNSNNNLIRYERTSGNSYNEHLFSYENNMIIISKKSKTTSGTFRTERLFVYKLLK